jgi:uncharacterized protein YndB with AHSA1/START domain
VPRRLSEYVNLSTPPEITFSALTDAELYSRWLQVPVTIEGGEFAATLEWGAEVRGRYEFVIPPQLITMSWDFDDETSRSPADSLAEREALTPQLCGGRIGSWPSTN